MRYVGQASLVSDDKRENQLSVRMCVNMTKMPYAERVACVIEGAGVRPIAELVLCKTEDLGVLKNGAITLPPAVFAMLSTVPKGIRSHIVRQWWALGAQLKQDRKLAFIASAEKQNAAIGNKQTGEFWAHEPSRVALLTRTRWQPNARVKR